MANKNFQITNNVQLFSDVYRMSIHAPEIVATARAGQFVHVRINLSIYPLLRRPFCIHSINEKDKQFDILYRIVGDGTRRLAEKKVGDSLGVLGPVGRGFGTDENFNRAIVVAGGMGIAPMFFLIDELIKPGRQVTLLWGARTGEEITCLSNYFEKKGVVIESATEDGSIGVKGFVTDLLVKHISPANDLSEVKGFVCGPTPMLKAVQTLIIDSRMNWEVSLEERMACGIGVCAGCNVKTIQGDNKLVCKDGPVMNLKEIDYEN